MKTSSFARIGLLIAALALAGCNETLDDIAPATGPKAERRLPDKLVQNIRSKGMAVNAPIMVRIFKEEAVLEVWKQKSNGRYDVAATYDICKWSGKLGPKFTEGDRQAPEGFYSVRPHQMNPQSSYHLSFNIGFPNAYDRAHGRSGQHLMIHGACSSAGCYSMTDPQMEQIYAFARDSFKGGQEAFQIQAFPFRMTAANMARYREDPNYEFWQMLKEGYDHFEITKVPPKVDVCGKRYVFNQMSSDGKGFSPSASCPAATTPESLQVAYRSYQATYQAAFNSAVGSVSRSSTPAPTIAGVKEAALVADWSRRRARGERVMREPPTLERPEILMAERQALPTAVALVPQNSPRRDTVAPAEATAAAPAATTSAPSGPVSTLAALFGRRAAPAATVPAEAEAAAAPAPATAAPRPSSPTIVTATPSTNPPAQPAAATPQGTANAEEAAASTAEQAPAPSRGIGSRLRSLFGG